MAQFYSTDETAIGAPQARAGSGRRSSHSRSRLTLQDIQSTKSVIEFEEEVPERRAKIRKSTIVFKNEESERRGIIKRKHSKNEISEQEVLENTGNSDYIENKPDRKAEDQEYSDYRENKPDRKSKDRGNSDHRENKPDRKAKDRLDKKKNDQKPHLTDGESSRKSNQKKKPSRDKNQEKKKLAAHRDDGKKSTHHEQQSESRHKKRKSRLHVESDKAESSSDLDILLKERQSKIQKFLQRKEHKTQGNTIPQVSMLRDNTIDFEIQSNNFENFNKDSLYEIKEGKIEVYDDKRKKARLAEMREMNVPYKVVLIQGSNSGVKWTTTIGILMTTLLFFVAWALALYYILTPEEL